MNTYRDRTFLTIKEPRVYLIYMSTSYTATNYVPSIIMSQTTYCEDVTRVLRAY